MQTSESPDTRPAPGAQKPLFFLGTESDPHPMGLYLDQGATTYFID